MASYPASYEVASVWHLLPLQASWRVQRVPCHETGYYHRHKTHEEKYTKALCGAKILEGQGNYCNLGFFLEGFRPDQPVCSACHKFVQLLKRERAL